MNLVVIGARIREARERAGRTLNDVATAAGVSASMVSQVERGKKVPSLKLLDRLSGALGVEVSVGHEHALAPRRVPRRRPTNPKTAS
jgi:transcriptional regulator with XRE-family HTH domain